MEVKPSFYYEAKIQVKGVHFKMFVNGWLFIYVLTILLFIRTI